VAARPAQRDDRGRSSRSVQVGRQQGNSPSTRGQVSTPRSVSQRQPQIRSTAPQRSQGSLHSERSRVSTPRNLPSRQTQIRGVAPQRQPEVRGVAPQRGGSRPEFELRGNADRERSQQRFTPSRPTPQRPDLRSRGPVGEPQRRDDRSGWRDSPRTQRPSDAGQTTRRSTETYDRGNRHQDGRYDTRSSGRDRTAVAARYDDRYAGRRTQQFDGHVQRLERGDGGYRVWLDRGDHCFWVPDARFLLWPLRIGISVSFGGFWNPAGYYNVYDYGPTFSPYYGSSYYGSSYYGSSYYGGSYYDRSYGGGSYDSSSFLQGYVDRFDDASGTFVVRDDGSGRYATVLIRSRDPQFDYLQPGDWVTLAGVWTRDGYFEAYRIEDLAQR
jgi:hypothetical protein